LNRFDARDVTFCPVKRAALQRFTADFFGTACAQSTGVKKVLRVIRKAFVVLTLYAIGLVEAYFLPRYGLEWLLGGLAATAFLAGLWLRTHWEA